MNPSCCTTDQDLIIQLIQNVILSMIANGQLQPALKACDGTTLGPAKVPDCATMTMAIQAAIGDIHTQSPVIGNGSEANPIGIDALGLQDMIKTAIASLTAQGLLISTDDTLKGTGAGTNKLGVNVATVAQDITDMGGLPATVDDSLTGSGTTNNPLGVSKPWVQNYLMNGAIVPSPGFSGVVTPTDEVSTNIMGGVSSTMGTPDGWFSIGGGFGIPVYRITGTIPLKGDN